MADVKILWEGELRNKGMMTRQDWDTQKIAISGEKFQNRKEPSHEKFWKVLS